MNGARRLLSITPFGADKMCRNVMALQQNLKNLGELPLHVDLDRSRSYYDLLRVQDPSVRCSSLHHELET
jgi:exocyst complex component 4